MNDKEIKIQEKFIHLYIAIKRKKENDQNAKRVFRQEIYDEELDKGLIKTKCRSIPGVWRIYKTINKRDVDKAKKLLQIEMIKNPDCNVISMYRTCLLQPTCKGERNFLIDIDKPEKAYPVQQILKENNVKIKDWIKTPNGYHLLTELFDTRLLKSFLEDKSVEIKRDAYIFVEIFEAKKDA